MRQGNTYSLAIELQDEAGSVIDIDLVDRVEFVFGPVRKTYPEDAKFDRDLGQFIVALTQQDTFMLDHVVVCQARIKFKDGTVVGTGITREAVYESISKEVL